MKWHMIFLWLMAAGMVFAGLGSCAGHSGPQDVSLPGIVVPGMILKEPARFEALTVTVTGVFYGWRGPCQTAPPVSRSDWMLADPSGCLYVNGPVPPDLDPLKPSGEEVSVTGVVRLKKGRPYLETAR